MVWTPPEPGPGIGDAQGGGAARPFGHRSAVRIINVVLWVAVALVCGAGGVGEVTIGNVGGAVVAFAVAVFAAWYAFRVWTFRARWMLGPADREWRR